MDQLISRETLSNIHNLYDNTAMWNGLYDSVGVDNAGDYDWIGTSYSLNLSSTDYDFNSDEQDCCYFFPGRRAVYDWYCNDDSREIGDGTNTWTACYTFICNKPKYRNYTITLDLNDNIWSGTGDTIWFRIKGSIVNVTEDEKWTDWFTRNGFNDRNRSYTWNVNLTNVGPAQSIIVLTHDDDGIWVDWVEVDEQRVTLASTINIRYYPGMFGIM